MADSLDCFPRGRVRARVISDTEKELGSLPMVLITPVVASVAGAVVAFVYAPAEHVHDGPSRRPLFGRASASPPSALRSGYYWC